MNSLLQQLAGYLHAEVAPGPLKKRSLKVMTGANYFSGGPVVVLRLALGAYDEVFTNEIPGFYDKLKAILPSLHHHHCSVGKEGGFFIRVQRGTLLGHVTEHVAIELQTLAGMDVAYGKTRSTSEQGVYNVVFRYLDELAGLYAAHAALNLVNSLLAGRAYDVPAVVRELVTIREMRLLGPSTQAIVDEAQERSIPCFRLDAYNLVQLGTGRHQKRVRATITSDTSLIGVETADNKYLTTIMLQDAGIPVPRTVIVDSADQAVAFCRDARRPITLKPRVGYKGKGVSNNLESPAQVRAAYAWAGNYDRRIMAQHTIQGHIYRLLVIGFRFVAASRLEVPCVHGDGKRTVKELIELLNQDPDRGPGDKLPLSRVRVNALTRHILHSRNLKQDSVLPPGACLQLKTSANLHEGGVSHDVTAEVDDGIKRMAERAARVIGLNVAGVDIVAPSVGASLTESGGKVIEINAAPDFRMHLMPKHGQKKNVAAPLVDMLFPPKQPKRVPLISVTGSVGKTITVKLMQHILQTSGYTVGMTSSDGLFVGDTCIRPGDQTYPEEVALLLRDPTIDFAVLETGREGILRRGLGYNLADVGVVLNLSEEHVGCDDISCIEDLAYAKSVVAEQVYEEGYAVLNADHELILEMEKRLYCPMALFTCREPGDTIRRHVDAGGLAAWFDRGDLLLFDNRDRRFVISDREMPMTFDGTAGLNHGNILAAVLALYAWGLPLEEIRAGLKSFRMDMLPGRLTFLPTASGTLLLDHAHNRLGFEGLMDFIQNQRDPAVGIITVPADKADADILTLGALAARTYDELVFYPPAGNAAKGRVTDLLAKGAAQAGAQTDRRLEPDQALQAVRDYLEAGRFVVYVTPEPVSALAKLRAFIHSQKTAK